MTNSTTKSDEKVALVTGLILGFMLGIIFMGAAGLSSLAQ